MGLFKKTKEFNKSMKALNEILADHDEKHQRQVQFFDKLSGCLNKDDKIHLRKMIHANCKMGYSFKVSMAKCFYQYIMEELDD